MPTASDQPTRVVIAEDEAIIRLDLKELLEEEGYEVVGETGRGDEAVELVRGLGPDLAILDIKMPGLDGLSAARHIAGERLAAVLILTAFSQRDLVEQARDAGAMSYIVKPFQKSDLIPAIEVALGRHAGADEPRVRGRRPRRAARGPQGDRSGQGHTHGPAWEERAGSMAIPADRGDEPTHQGARGGRTSSSSVTSFPTLPDRGARRRSRCVTEPRDRPSRTSPRSTACARSRSSR